MDRGKGGGCNGVSDFRGIKTKNIATGTRTSGKVSSVKVKTATGSAPTSNTGQMDYFSTFAQQLELQENYRFSNHGVQKLSCNDGFDAGVLMALNPDIPPNSIMSSAVMQSVLNNVPAYNQLFSSEARQKQLYHEDQVFMRLFENTLAGEYLECNGAIVKCNRRFGELLCQPSDIIIGKQAVKFLGIDSASLVFRRIDTGQTRDSEVAEFAVKVNSAGGGVRWLNCSITRFVWDTLHLSFGSFVDISDQVQNNKSLNVAKRKIQNLSLQLIGAQEVERKRVASELHDGISQSLSAIKLNIEQYIAVTNKPDGGERDMDKETADLGSRLVLNMQNTIEEIRRIAVDLRPSMLDDLGLVQTLHWFCRDFQSVHRQLKINKILSIRDENIPDSLKIVIYRIIQESLNNVSKHANATEVHVEIAVMSKGIRLCVRDNGDGIKEKNQPAASPIIGGMGLRSMRERARSTGALFKIRSVPGRGVSLHVLWSHPQIERLRRQAVVDYIGCERRNTV